MGNVTYIERFASHPEDARHYDTAKLRSYFLVEELFRRDSIHMLYSHYDRFIVGGAMPVNSSVELETIDPLKAGYFLERREMGIINVGGKGRILSEEGLFELDYKEALYLGKEVRNVQFISEHPDQPAKFYFNSAPAHRKYPNRKVAMTDAEILDAGSFESSNARKINKLLINSVIDTCQLQMGLTELKTGSVWNTMPAHVHSRRMEVYFYFEVPNDQAICHFMGQPSETRHLWMKNEEAVISPDWSIHAAAGTGNYSFIWGMAGENLDYSDMDVCLPENLR